MKKRKFDKINDITKTMNIKCENKRINLSINIPDKLPCMICGIDVYNYKMCMYHLVYCGYDCFSILMLSNKRGYLHEKDTDISFNDTDDDLMLL